MFSEMAASCSLSILIFHYFFPCEHPDSYFVWVQVDLAEMATMYFLALLPFRRPRQCQFCCCRKLANSFTIRSAKKLASILTLWPLEAVSMYSLQYISSSWYNPLVFNTELEGKGLSFHSLLSACYSFSTTTAVLLWGGKQSHINIVS